MFSLLRYRCGLFLAGVVVLGTVLADVATRSTAERLLHLGRDALRRSEWDQVQRCADRLALSEDRDGARLLRGEMLYAQKKLASAIDVLNRVRSDGAVRVQAALIQGLAYLELGDSRNADAAFRYVLDHQPDNVDALRGLASIAYYQGMWLHAGDYLRRLTTLVPEDGRPHWTLGMIYRDLSIWNEAEQHLRNALERHLPPAALVAAQADLAQVLASLKKYDEALAVTDKIPAAERSPTVWQIRADCWRSLNRLLVAEREAGQAATRFPDHAELVAEYGLILLDQEQTTEAIRVLQQSLQRDPHMIRARQGLVRAYQRLGQSDEAAQQQRLIQDTEGYLKQLSDLTDTAMKKPWDASVRMQLAKVCQKLNKTELARSWALAAAACEQR